MKLGTIFKSMVMATALCFSVNGPAQAAISGWFVHDNADGLYGAGTLGVSGAPPAVNHLGSGLWTVDPVFPGVVRFYAVYSTGVNDDGLYDFFAGFNSFAPGLNSLNVYRDSFIPANYVTGTSDAVPPTPGTIAAEPVVTAGATGLVPTPFASTAGIVGTGFSGISDIIIVVSSTAAGDGPYSAAGGFFSPAAIPEPGSFVLLGSLGLVAWFVRRRRAA